MSTFTLQVLGILSAIIGVIALIPYFIDIFRGNTKPQRMAFLIFSILATISFFGQWLEGASGSLWFALILMISPWFIFLLSLKRGVGGFETKDKISLVLSVLILILWYFTESAALAIVLVVLVNTIAKYLVAVKVYKLPYSELLFTWNMSVVASIFAALAVGGLDWILLLPPVQNAVTVGIVAAIIFYRRKKLEPPKDYRPFKLKA